MNNKRPFLLWSWVVAGIILVLIAAWGDHPDVLSDAKVYRHAIELLHSGRNPYLDGLIAQERAQHEELLHQTWTYIYLPVTLPLLRLIGYLPAWLYESLYWVAYVIGSITQLWACLSILTSKEHRVANYLAPACFVFPLLMYSNQALFSGNVAYILYGTVLSAAVKGWRKGEWKWFYVTVLLASCVKPQMLTLLAIPVFSATEQWLGAVLTGCCSMAVIGSQILFWPYRFREYTHVVDVQFVNYDREFGIGPVGILGKLLWQHGLPYKLPCAIAYVLFGSLIVAALFTLSRLYHAGRLSLASWLPTLLIGTILLNPRIFGTDIFCLTIPMAVIVWRILMALTSTWKKTLIYSLAIMLGLNLMSNAVIQSIYVYYYLLAMLMVLACFWVSFWQLRRQALAA